MTENNNVMAVINGRELTRKEVQEFINMMGAQGNQFRDEAGMNKVAQELLNQELFYLDAIKEGLDKDEEYLKEVERSKENMLKQFAINKLLKDVVVSDEELKDYYEEHKVHFQNPMQFEASHILVTEEDKAKEIKDKIDAGEITFEDAAVEYSSCPSKEKGGSLGKFSEGQMVKEFEDAAKVAEIGKITDPVQTQFGFHIIRVDDRQDKSTAEFEDVKEQIRGQALSLKQQQAYLDKVDEIAKDYKVEKFF